MCKENQPPAWRLVGRDIDVVAAALGDKETTPQLDANDGDVIGISVGENYSRTILGKTLITIEVDGLKPVTNLPLTQLLPDGERHYWPVKIAAGLKPKIKLTCRDNTMVAANPIVLITHHAKLASCK